MRCLPLNIYKEVYTFGTSILVCWFCKDTVKFHSFNDQPAYVSAGRHIMEWYKEDCLSRGFDKAAVIELDGKKYVKKEWWVEGKLIKELRQDGTIRCYFK